MMFSRALSAGFMPWFPRVCAAMLCIMAVSSCSAPTPGEVVIIGGAPSEGPGRHAYILGVKRLREMIASSPDARDVLKVIAYPDGWPSDPHALDHAATIVWYFDGLDHHPLNDPAHRAQIEAARKRGAGLVVLHQASTAPATDTLGLDHLLGGVRVGMFDRTTEWTTLEPTHASNPILHGLAGMSLRDEFYPTYRFAGEGKRTAILSAALHPQYRDGKAVLSDKAEHVDVAWAYEDDAGARSFVFTGAHFLRTLYRQDVARMLVNAVLWTAKQPVPDDGAEVPAASPPVEPEPAPPPQSSMTRATFHANSARTGWYADQQKWLAGDIRPDNFGIAWESEPLDAIDGQPPRLYAAPLFIDALTLTSGPLRGESFSVVIAASNNGFVYAINAKPHGDIAPGRILWRRQLEAPCHLQPAPLDGVPTGILSTPIADVKRGRLYVAHCAAGPGWQAYAIDLGSGEVIDGWPVRMDEPTLNTVNANAGEKRLPPTRRFDFRVQRGALNLSPDGSQLYVVFGETETGWLAAVDTVHPRIRSAFAAVAMPHRGSGGIWGAGGPAVDEGGHVYVVTGSGFDGYRDLPHDWTQSLLKLAPPTDAGGFALRGTYTPFNYCLTAKMDIDLGSGGAALLAAPAKAGDARLMVVGGKQGNVYLLDRDRLPGGLERRPACSADASSDASLLPPGAQPQFGTRGPLNVFGPYSEEDASMDVARSRSVPATFQDAKGADYVYVTGNNKAAKGSAVSVAPSLVRLKVERPAKGMPYLRVDAAARTLVMANPGSPVVTSQGAERPVVWVLDENAPRSSSLAGPGAPQPVLYAVDGMTMQVLWQSLPGELFTSGKYNEPTFGNGQVIVGTDRIQAFGVGGRRLPGRQAPPIETKAIATKVSTPAAIDASADAKAIFAQRCAMCHDHPQGNIPPHEVLRTRPRQRIVDALSKGVMRPQAAGLTEEQIQEVANYLGR